MKKILNILLAVLMAVSVVMLVLVFVMGDTGVSLILNWTYVLVGLAVLSAVVLPLINLAQNPKGALRSLGGLVIMVVLVGVAFVIASAEPIVLPDKTVYSNVFGLKLTDAGLYVTYACLVGAMVAAIFGEIRNSFK